MVSDFSFPKNSLVEKTKLRHNFGCMCPLLAYYCFFRCISITRSCFGSQVKLDCWKVHVVSSISVVSLSCSLMCFGRKTFWDWRIFGRDRNLFLNQNREGNSFFFEIQRKNHTLSILAHDSCGFHAVFCLAYFVYSTFESFRSFQTEMRLTHFRTRPKHFSKPKSWR